MTASASPAGATLQLLEQARRVMGLPSAQEAPVRPPPPEPGEPEPAPKSAIRRAAARCWALLLVRIYIILPSGAHYGLRDFGAELLAEETLTVPAGDLVCFGRRSFADGPFKAMFGGAYDLCGQVAGGRSDLVEHWVSRDVGIVLALAVLHAQVLI